MLPSAELRFIEQFSSKLTLWTNHLIKFKLLSLLIILSIDSIRIAQFYCMVFDIDWIEHQFVIHTSTLRHVRYINYTYTKFH